jgi:4-hydroxy-tetrahydrodipicolinate synthase
MRIPTVRQIPPALSGVFSALPTPLHEDGTPSFEDIGRILDFLLSQQVRGFCVGGVTGEYASLSVGEREDIFHNVSRHLQGKANLILGVGAECAGHVIRLAQAAAEEGAIAVLLPPPSFLRFDPADLMSFLEGVAGDLPLPVLLYNIPQFTQNVGIRNMLRLIESVPNIVGIKDSSGQLLNLRLIRDAKARSQLAFFVGSDELFLEASDHGADGAISGTASAYPELLLATCDAYRCGERQRARLLQSRIEEFCVHSSEFPSPWAIKLALQARGIGVGNWSWSPGKALSSKMQTFQKWFSTWKSSLDLSTGASGEESLRGLPRPERSVMSEK